MERQIKLPSECNFLANVILDLICLTFCPE